jgi:hypothetical protein
MIDYWIPFFNRMEYYKSNNVIVIPDIYIYI